jgi:hypothetical protein
VVGLVGRREGGGLQGREFVDPAEFFLDVADAVGVSFVLGLKCWVRTRGLDCLLGVRYINSWGFGVGWGPYESGMRVD